jgi:hypothetical protein
MPGPGDAFPTEDQTGFSGWDQGQLPQTEQAWAGINPEGTLAQVEQALRPVRQTLLTSPIGSAMQNLGLVNPPQTLTADQATQKYGVPGYLKFDQPVEEGDAELDNEQARQKQWHDFVWSRTDHSMLSDLYYSLPGMVTDPVNDALAMSGIGEGLFGLAFGEKSAAAAYDATEGLGTMGKVWNGALPALGKTAFAQLPFVGKDLLLDYTTGHLDDFDMGSELSSVAAFAILHLGLHTGMNALGVGLDALGGARRAGAVDGAGAPPGPAAGVQAQDFAAARAFEGEAPSSRSPTGVGRPVEVNMADTATRGGAFVGAVDEVRQGESTTVGQKLIAALQRPGIEGLDEEQGGGAPPSFRPAPEGAQPHGFALTSQGREIGVRYGVVEAGELTASHDVAGRANPRFPEQLAPERAPQTGANIDDPRSLMGSGLADGARGAPVIGHDGVVESGGDTVALLQRAAMIRSPAYERYVAALKAAGLPVDGMQAPVLVRLREDAMTGASRAVVSDEMSPFAQPMNEAETALADARRLGPEELEALTGDDDAARRAMERQVAGRLSPDEALTDEHGRLTADGARRVSNALVAHAFGNHDVTAAVLSGELRHVGAAMRAAAPAWSRMRQAIDRGEVPRALDMTVHLNSAAVLTKAAFDNGQSVGEFLGPALSGEPLVGGGMLSPEEQGLIRNFFRNEAMSQPRAAESIAGVLRSYAEWATPDVAGLARRSAPETFAEYDRLADEMELQRGRLRELGPTRENLPEAVKARADEDAILERVKGVEARLTKAAAERLANARARLGEALGTDTPEMAEARSKLMEADQGRRALAVQVSRALREADATTAEGGEFLRGYAEWAAKQEEAGRGDEETADAGTASRQSFYRKNALGWDDRGNVERPAGGTEGAREPAAGLGAGYAEPGVEGGEPRGGGVPQAGGGEPEGGGGPQPGAGGGPERERADVARPGGAEPAVPGRPGGEPAAEAEGGRGARAGAATAGVNPKTAAQIIASAPELRDLQASLDKLVRKTGKAADYGELKDPATIAEAMRAAAACLKGEL